ncbi:MAG TPA: UDP-2,3-diacylglucosamine diphosphatase [Solimonas sp.]|nr:UDP-2,3-diacylglucosamine diphosphatase [Solimonas sp.]
MTTLLLSDLHLPNTPSPLREGFLRFLHGPAAKADAIYLLGDIFEYWIGDDVGIAEYAAEVASLRALSEAGVRLYFMRGNRDFLLGPGFAKATRGRLLPDPSVIEFDGLRALLGHGDLWCTGDKAYQRWRRFSRNRLAQWLFLQLPIERRRAIAGDLRGKSREHKRYKPEDIMDVDPEVIVRTMREHGVARLIHGHTHRPADHQLRVGNHRAQRIVLADWREDRMEYLVAEDGQLRRVQLPPAG